IKFHLFMPKNMVKALLRTNKSKKRGIHIRKYGDMASDFFTNDCHFNPTEHNHGSKDSSIRHLGDLGNIDLTELDSSKNLDYRFQASGMSLDYSDGFSRCILGRLVVITAKEDDLGLLDNKESKINGNSGVPFSYGIIGISVP
ncbi:MAG: hypothetical protein MHPSP_001867, partial [Paramarteilia canceri]